MAPLSAGQEPRRSDLFNGPPRDPPSRDLDFLHLRFTGAFDWENESIDGEVLHRARALKDGVRAVTLDAVGIDVTAAELEGGPALSVDTLPGSIRVDLGRSVRRGDEVAFTLRYRVRRPQQGVYFQQPDASYPDRPRQVWTQGEAEEARHWIPCFDHPSDKLTTEMIITAPKGLTVISNGRLVSTSAGAGGSQVFHWLQEKPHTTYLISVVIGDFAVWQGEAEGIPLRGFVQRKHEAWAARSFDLTGDMLRFFNRRFGVPYPWPKYDQLCVYAFNAGGMENTSATTLTEATLHDERAALDVSSLGLVAHELAHQWFGDLVTCKDWGDIWLNESFATFAENLYTEHQLGWDEAAYDRWEQAESYGREDRERYRRRLSTRTWRTPESLFDRHAYPKGARVLNMLRHVLGEEMLFAGVKRFLEKHAFQPVEAHDFRIALEEATGTSLGWFFDQWIFAGGHPRYRIAGRWDERDRALKIDVEQVHTVDDLTPLFRMPVVLALTLPSGKVEHRVWVAEKRQSFTFPAAERPRMVRFDPGDWILKEVEYERSREELLYQLEHDGDVMGRHEAAEVLGRSAGDLTVETALLRRLESEPFWGVRLAIVRALGEPHAAATRDALVARFRREPRARVRSEIVTRLSASGKPEVIALLRDAFQQDPSYFVAARSLAGLGKLLKRDAHPLALAGLERDSHGEVIREAAVDILSSPDLVPPEARAETVSRLAAMLRPGASPSFRGALLRGLGRIGRGSEDAFQALASALNDSHPLVRGQAAQGLGDLGDRRALALLEERRPKERPVILRGPLRAIQQAIERIEGGSTLKDLEEELRRLREKDARLEERLRAIEEKGRSDGKEASEARL